MSAWRRPNTAAPPKCYGLEPPREKILTIKSLPCGIARMLHSAHRTADRKMAEGAGRIRWRRHDRPAVSGHGIFVRAAFGRAGGGRDPIHRAPSGLGADRPDRNRGAALADLCSLAARP